MSNEDDDNDNSLKLNLNLKPSEETKGKHLYQKRSTVSRRENDLCQGECLANLESLVAQLAKDHTRLLLNQEKNTEAIAEINSTINNPQTLLRKMVCYIYQQVVGRAESMIGLISRVGAFLTGLGIVGAGLWYLVYNIAEWVVKTHAIYQSFGVHGL